MKEQLICSCGKEPKQVDKVVKITGYQYTEEVVGVYLLYECECGEKHWTFNKRW